jgi:hypothetical protein
MTVLACATCGSVHDDGNTTDLTALPDCYHLGDDPDLLRDELRDLLQGHINAHPRSKQIKPGPSDLGTPCSRYLGYKMLGTDPLNTDGDTWRATVGTALHSWVEKACHAYNNAHKIERYYLEQKVVVGQVGGQDIKGQCDLYDRARGLVVDWKSASSNKLKQYRIAGPPQNYRIQAHLYGRGYQLLGLPVERVAICFLPRDGFLWELSTWSEPYDEQVAIDALTRADGIHSLTASLGRAALPLLPTAEHFCDSCPYRMAASTDVTEACPGHTSPASVQLTVPTAPAA